MIDFRCPSCGRRVSGVHVPFARASCPDGCLELGEDDSWRLELTIGPGTTFVFLVEGDALRAVLVDERRGLHKEQHLEDEDVTEELVGTALREATVHAVIGS